MSKWCTYSGWPCRARALACARAEEREHVMPARVWFELVGGWKKGVLSGNPRSSKMRVTPPGAWRRGREEQGSWTESASAGSAERE